MKFRGLEAGLSYEVFFEDYGIKIVKSGQSLLKEGLELRIPEAAGSLLITYRVAGR